MKILNYFSYTLLLGFTCLSGHSFAAENTCSETLAKSYHRIFSDHTRALENEFTVVEHDITNHESFIVMLRSVVVQMGKKVIELDGDWKHLDEKEQAQLAGEITPRYVELVNAYNRLANDHVLVPIGLHINHNFIAASATHIDEIKSLMKEAATKRNLVLTTSMHVGPLGNLISYHVRGTESNIEEFKKLIRVIAIMNDGTFE